MSYKVALILFFLSFMVLAKCSSVFGQNIFVKEFDFDTFIKATSLLQASDGGYIAGGYTSEIQPNDAVKSFPCIFRFNAEGNMLWAKKIAGASEGQVAVMRASSDGNFFATGFLDQNPQQDFVIKFDSAANILWSKAFNGGAQSQILTTSDDGGCITGGAQSPIVCFSSNGTMLWNEAIHDQFVEMDVRSILRLVDGNYIITGNCVDPLTFTMIKIDSLGNMLWYKTLSGNGTLFNFSSCSTADGGFAVCGMLELSISNHDAYIGKFDSSGALLWGRAVDAFAIEEAYSIIEAQDGDLLAACSGSPTGAMIIRMDNEGNIKNVKSLSDTLTPEVKAIIQSSKGNIVYAGSLGQTRSRQGGGLLLGSADFLLNGCHLESSLFTSHSSGVVQSVFGYISIGGVLNTTEITSAADLNFQEIDLCEAAFVPALSAEHTPVVISPNPITGNDPLTIHTDEVFPAGVYDVYCCDLPGNILKSERINFKSGEQRILFDISGYAAGTYFVELQSENDKRIRFRIKCLKQN